LALATDEPTPVVTPYPTPETMSRFERLMRPFFERVRVAGARRLLPLIRATGRASIPS